jgi:type I restriction enzyme S subunit
LFKAWFVDFEPVRAKMEGRWQRGQSLPGLPAHLYDLFPDRLVESELGEIPEGWEVTDFGSVSTCFDNRRIPLSSREREKRKGTIPYYGATSVMDYVDEAIFDGIYLLLGEDGSVLKPDSTPFIQYIWGKAWVNNHAHVLQGANGISTEQLMLSISSQNISAYVTGAVQPKLNQKNMNSIPFLKANDEINSQFAELIAPLFSQYRSLVEESRTLAQLRDTLLPKLISGEIRVADAAAFIEGVIT